MDESTDQTDREKALEAVTSGHAQKSSFLHSVFTAILELLRPERQDLRDLYFEGLKRAFPIEFRMVEVYLIEGRISEHPDGFDDLNHFMEEDLLWHLQQERKLGKVLDGQLEEVLREIGETVDIDSQPPSDSGDDTGSDAGGDIPN